MVGESKIEIVRKCEELIRSYNPITHSIDTHVNESLAKKSKVFSFRDYPIIVNLFM
jgi:hypothetical protein